MMERSGGLWLLAAACIAGCQHDSGPKRYELSGQVTFEGRPVPHGQIRFLPDTARGNRGPAGFAVIHNGRYDTRSDGKGIVGGSHVVIIDGFDGVADPEAELDYDKTLFSSYRKTEEFPTQNAVVDFNVLATYPP